MEDANGSARTLAASPGCAIEIQRGDDSRKIRCFEELFQFFTSLCGCRKRNQWVAVLGQVVLRSGDAMRKFLFEKTSTKSTTERMLRRRKAGPEISHAFRQCTTFSPRKERTDSWRATGFRDVKERSRPTLPGRRSAAAWCADVYIPERAADFKIAFWAKRSRVAANGVLLTSRRTDAQKDKFAGVRGDAILNSRLFFFAACVAQALGRVSAALERDPQDSLDVREMPDFQAADQFVHVRANPGVPLLAWHYSEKHSNRRSWPTAAPR
jgi:hypothetical protein